MVSRPWSWSPDRTLRMLDPPHTLFVYTPWMSSWDDGLGLQTKNCSLGLGLEAYGPDLGFILLVSAVCCWSWCDSANFSFERSFTHHQFIHIIIMRYLKWTDWNTEGCEDSTYKHRNHLHCFRSWSQVFGLGLKYYGLETIEILLVYHGLA